MTWVFCNQPCSMTSLSFCNPIQGETLKNNHRRGVIAATSTVVSWRHIQFIQITNSFTLRLPWAPAQGSKNGVIETRRKMTGLNPFQEYHILSFVLFLKIIYNLITKVICLKMFIGLSPQIYEKYSRSRCDALHLLDAHLIMSTGKERRLSISVSVRQETTIMALPYY